MSDSRGITQVINFYGTGIGVGNTGMGIRGGDGKIDVPTVRRGGASARMCIADLINKAFRRFDGYRNFKS